VYHTVKNKEFVAKIFKADEKGEKSSMLLN